MNKNLSPCPERTLEQLITCGGDERLDVLDHGMNKYYVDLEKSNSTFNRASCTCSPFSPDGLIAARKLFDHLDDDVFDEVREIHTRKLKKLINYDGLDNFHVFYAPSGSDLCYFPLLFSKLIHPNRDIFNIVTCPEELGSGSNTAFQGKCFFNKNQYGEEVVKDEALSDQLKISSVSFPARDDNGQIVDHRKSLYDIVHKTYRSHAVNANLVIGSKSGIENNISIVSHTPEDVLWTIDLCQFRASRVLINGLIGMNCCVMLTGSKFYQSPPFCAVLLVPKSVSKKFKKATKDLVSPFAKVFSKHDIPEDFDDIREHLPDFRNYGLLLRWEAALEEMLSLAELDTYEVNLRIEEWNKLIVTALGESKYFQLMPGQNVTNKTIVSFRVKSGEDKYLGHQELSELYSSICQQKIDGMGMFDRVLFGQPVKYGDKSFIRIALGASDVRAFVNNGIDFTNDRRLIEIIENYTERQYWN